MRRTKQALVSLALVLALLLSPAAPAFAAAEGTPEAPQQAAADEPAVQDNADGFTQGTEEGANYAWKLDGNGTLTIRGTKMAEWASDTDVPWADAKDSIQSVVLGSDLTNIGSYAFYACTGLTGSLKIPAKVKSIGRSAFVDCFGLTDITIPNGVTAIGNNAFNGCFGLTHMTIPNSVTAIGGDTFRGCFGLTDITIPGSVTAIGSYAFIYCNGLTEVTLSRGLKSIGDFAFSDCGNLQAITIPDSVTSMGRAVFASCDSFARVVFLGDAPTIHERTFAGYDGKKIAAAAYYPRGNKTWTQDKRQDYGGTLTWKAYDDPNNLPPPEPSIFTITYHNLDGTTETLQVEKGEGFTVRDVPEGYLGWSSKPDGSDYVHTPGVHLRPAGNMDLYLVKKPDDPQPSGEVTVKDGGASGYVIDGEKVLSGVKPDTSIEAFKSNLKDGETLVVKNAQGKTVETPEKNTRIGTGWTVGYGADGETGKVTVMIAGDTDGNGRISLDDVVRIRQSILRVSELEGVFLRAAKPVSEGKGDLPALDDVTRVRQYLLRIVGSVA